jgi:UDP-glucose 4-epimerase
MSRTGEKWLVTGGAGYIGSHVVRELLESGVSVLVVDDLSSGRQESLLPEVEFHEGTILDQPLLAKALRGVTGVVHVAGRKAARESVRDPISYFETNVLGSHYLLNAVIDAEVENLVFSSSCSVYGTPPTEIVTESTSTSPESPYAESKLITEMMMSSVARGQTQSGRSPLRWMSLRYFNVIGCNSQELADKGADNLVPTALRAFHLNKEVTVYGTDWPTPDGTCIRDYVDVGDLADAHARAASLLSQQAWTAGPINISTGIGASVREVLAEIQTALGEPVRTVAGPRRPGDPAKVIGNPGLARKVLGWTPKTGLRDSVAKSVDHFRL